jgi:hypothetical protein
VDLEVIEYPGPVTTMAGKDFMAFERVPANTRGFIKKNGKHQKRKVTAAWILRGPRYR